MNTGKPTKKTVLKAASSATGTVLGVATVRGTEAYYPTDQNVRRGLRLAVASVLVLGGSMIKSDDALSNGLKGAAYGGAAMTVLNGVRDEIKSSSFATQDSSAKPLIKFAHGALDVGCGCNSTTINNTLVKRNFASLNQAFKNIVTMQETSEDVYEANRATLLA